MTVLTTQRRTGVLAVPVAALHDGPGGTPSVTVIGDDGSQVERAVAIGLVAQGWAELSSGAHAGERVALPG